jgi:hypothetical protein
MKGDLGARGEKGLKEAVFRERRRKEAWLAHENEVVRIVSPRSRSECGTKKGDAWRAEHVSTSR